MIVRQDLNELPPKAFLMQVTDNLTKIYCFLWDRKDNLNRISLTWKDLSMHYNKNTFKTGLRKLGNVGLLNYFESEDKLSIELVGWDDVADEE